MPAPAQNKNDVEDINIEGRLTALKANLDELSKGLQYILQREVTREDGDTDPIDRAIARSASASLMITDILHDLDVVKLNIMTLYSMMGCDKMPKDKKEKEKEKNTTF